jgi:hypothetical protein
MDAGQGQGGRPALDDEALQRGDADHPQQQVHQDETGHPAGNPLERRIPPAACGPAG